MKLFMIDQGSDLPKGPIIQRFSEYGSSNAAFNSYGGPRIATKGWNKKYWDHGKQYDKDGKPINQAHHFAAFFIEGLKSSNDRELNDARAATVWFDALPLNRGDQNLGWKAVELGHKVRAGDIKWGELPGRLFSELRK